MPLHMRWSTNLESFKDLGNSRSSFATATNNRRA